MDPNYARLSQRLDEMPSQDGWLDGNGVATTPQAIFTLRLASLALLDAEVMRDPHVYPRPCGGCQAEWETGSVGFELRVLSAGNICELDVYDQRGTRRGNGRFEDECLAFDPRDTVALSTAVEKACELIRVYA